MMIVGTDGMSRPLSRRTSAAVAGPARITPMAESATVAAVAGAARKGVGLVTMPRGATLSIEKRLAVRPR